MKLKENTACLSLFSVIHSVRLQYWMLILNMTKDLNKEVSVSLNNPYKPKAQALYFILLTLYKLGESQYL